VIFYVDFYVFEQILEIIFQFRTIQKQVLTLLLFRLVNKQWNFVTSRLLKYDNSIHVSFLRDFDLKYFTLLMGRRIQPFFLTKFDFNLEMMSVDGVFRFAREFGAYAKEYILDTLSLHQMSNSLPTGSGLTKVNIEVSEKALILLRESPNLVNLRLHKLILVDTQLLSKYSLPQYKNLTHISYSENSWSIGGGVKFPFSSDFPTILSLTIANAPNLLECTLTPTYETSFVSQIYNNLNSVRSLPSNAMFTTTLKSFCSLKFEEVRKLQNVSFEMDKIRRLKIEIIAIELRAIEPFQSFFTKFLQSQSGSQTTLALTAGKAWKFPKLGALEVLDIGLQPWAERMILTPELIPKLWSVTLSGRQQYETFTPWKWPGVTKLSLSKKYLTSVVHESSPLTESVAKAFPNLTSLTLATYCMRADIKTVLTYFTTLTTLSLIFDEDRNLFRGNNAWAELTGNTERIPEDILLSTETNLEPPSSPPTFRNLPRNFDNHTIGKKNV